MVGWIKIISEKNMDGWKDKKYEKKQMDGWMDG